MLILIALNINEVDGKLDSLPFVKESLILVLLVLFLRILIFTYFEIN